jgi:hypothetical protein
MSRKDYIVLANVIRDLRKTSLLPGGWERVATAIGEVLKKDNPRFDYDRFWNYIER